MNKKCVGCGATMQCLYEDKEGYVEENKYSKAEICKRCFRIKYYGDYKYIDKKNSDFINILKNIGQTGDLVLYMIDLFNIDKDIDEIYRYLDNPVILVITKKDILPKSILDKKILNYFNNQGINIVDSIVISSKKNYNFDRLYQLIKMHKKSNNVYIVGNTNVGKSTFVNRCITNFGDKNANITTSILPSTTLDTLTINISEYLTLIDTPGILSNNSYINLVDFKTLKKIVPKKTIKPIIYQMKTNSSILIGSLARIDYEIIDPKSINDIVIYISNDIKINKANISTNNQLRDLKCHNFDIKSREDIVINGLGWIKISSPCNIRIYLPKEVDIYRRNCII